MYRDQQEIEVLQVHLELMEVQEIEVTQEQLEARETKDQRENEDLEVLEDRMVYLDQQ